MEIKALKYFIVAAELENIHKAAQKLLISPGTLSKTISKLEQDLGTKLFIRHRKTIKLSCAGKILKEEAINLIFKEESIRIKLAGAKELFNVFICGNEYLLSEYGIELTSKIRSIYPKALFNFESCSSTDAIEKIQFGDSHIAISTIRPNQFKYKKISEVKFEILATNEHPLYKGHNEIVNISKEELLKYDFAVSHRHDNDLYSDTDFELLNNNIKYQTYNYSTLQSIVRSGVAISLVPTNMLETMNASIIKVKDFNLSKKLDIYLFTKQDISEGWINQIW